MTSNDEINTSIPDEDGSPLVKARLTVHTDSREEFRLDVGEMKASQLETLNQLVANAFVMGPSKDWSIRVADGRDFHFNSDHVVLVIIEVS